MDMQTFTLLDGTTVVYPAHIPFGTVFPVQIDGNQTVDPEGQAEIQNLLHGNGFMPVPDDWDWSLTVEAKGEYTGSLPTRIAKWVRVSSNGKQKLTPAFKSELGNIASRFSLACQTYYVEFSRTLAWLRGDFGDEHSCYFGGEKDAARYVLGNAGGCAVKLYRADGVGYARCWLLPVRVRDTWTYVLFNAYHNTERVKTQVRLAHFAQLVVRLFGSDYAYRVAKVKDETGYLYINSYNYLNGERDEDDPSKQYIVVPARGLWPKQLIYTLDESDLHVETWAAFRETCGWTENVRLHDCYSCGNDGDCTLVSGVWVCARCYPEQVMTCAGCQMAAVREQLSAARRGGMEMFLCRSCTHGVDYYFCPVCGVFCAYADGQPTHLTRGDLACPACMADVSLVGRCAVCGGFDWVAFLYRGAQMTYHRWHSAGQIHDAFVRIGAEQPAPRETHAEETVHLSSVLNSALNEEAERWAQDYLGRFANERPRRLTEADIPFED